MGTVVVILLISLFTFDYWSSGKKNEYENNLVPLLSFRCGGNFGWTNFMKPFVRHAVYEDFVVIAYRNTKLVLPFKDITKISEPWYLFGNQVRYHHTNTKFPKKVIVRGNEMDTLKELLNTKGVSCDHV